MTEIIETLKINSSNSNLEFVKSACDLTDFIYYCVDINIVISSSILYEALIFLDSKMGTAKRVVAVSLMNGKKKDFFLF